MSFCQTCGTFLLPVKTPYGKWLSCPNGHSQPILQQESAVFTQKNVLEGKRIEIASEQNFLAVYEHACKKCGHPKAQLIEISASYSDEDNMYRMKCGKCGFVEQLEGKVK